MSPQVLSLILKALDANDEVAFSREDIAAWPDGDFEEALRTGLLEKAEFAEEVVCPGCEEACLEDVEFVYGDRPEDTRAYVVCGQRDDIGRVRIPLEQLQRWAVNVARIKELHPELSDNTPKAKSVSLAAGAASLPEPPKMKPRRLSIEEVVEILHWTPKTIQNWNADAKKDHACNDYWWDVLVIDEKTERVVGYDADKLEDWRNRRRPSVAKTEDGPAIEEGLSLVEKEDGRACDACNRKPEGKERFAVALIPDNPNDPNSSETKLVICQGCYKDNDERYRKLIREYFDSEHCGKPPSWLK